MEALLCSHFAQLTMTGSLNVWFSVPLANPLPHSLWSEVSFLSMYNEQHAHHSRQILLEIVIKMIYWGITFLVYNLILFTFLVASNTPVDVKASQCTDNNEFPQQSLSKLLQKS